MEGREENSLRKAAPSYGAAFLMLVQLLLDLLIKLYYLWSYNCTPFLNNSTYSAGVL